MRLIKSRNGYQLYGRDGGLIKSAAVIVNPGQNQQLAGTVSAGTTGTPSKNLTGVGTTFTTDFEVGEFIEFDLGSPAIAMVKTITSATAIVLGNPAEPGEDFPMEIPAGTTYRKFTALWVGRTAESGISLTTEESVAETKSSDDGETAVNVFSSSVKPAIKFTLMEASIEVLNILLKGMVNFTKDVNGKIIASSFGDRTGYDFKKNAIRVAVIEYDGESISSDPNDCLTIFKVGFKGNFNLTKNAKDQAGIELDGYIFKDDSKRIKGKPQYWAINEAAMAWDV